MEEVTTAAAAAVAARTRTWAGLRRPRALNTY